MVPSGLAGRNLIEEYEISRNVGLGIAVAGIRGVAGLGGRTRACGWDWGRRVGELAISGGRSSFIPAVPALGIPEQGNNIHYG